MDLIKAKKEGFESKNLIETKVTTNKNKKKKALAVIGILTGFGHGCLPVEFPFLL